MSHKVAPALSVLVPTHGRPDALLALLDGLARQTLAPSRFEVLVVDDGTPEAIELEPERYPFPLQLLRRDVCGGPAAARNLGLERCAGELVLFLNDDAVVAEDLLEQHLAAHERAPERTAVLGTFRFTERARRRPFVQVLDESDLLFSFSKLRPGELHDWRFFWTCNLSLPVDAVRGVGGFDAERFDRAIVEDCELGYRLFLEGWRVLHAPECRCEHDHDLTPEAFLSRAQRLGFYLARMQEKHGLPEILMQESEEAVQELRRRALDIYEAQRPVLERLGGALEQLDRDHAGQGVPAQVRDQAAGLTAEVGYGAFAAGVHQAVTGVDPTTPPREAGLTSIVVVSCDQLDSTRRCVEALRASRDDEQPFELIVVDNGSTDGSAEWLAAQEDLTLLRNATNVGAPRARNQATARARGAWIAYLDNDVYVPQGWLGRALYHGAVDPSVGAVALVANRASKFQQVPYDGGDTTEDIATFAEARYAEYGRRGQDADLFTSLAVLVRREVVDRIGGFDERFSPWGFEDDDLALRVRFAGWKNRVALDTFVFHAPYPDEAKHRRHSAHLQANWERFAKKWGRPGPAPERFDYAALELDLGRPAEEHQLVFPLAAEPAPAEVPAATPQGSPRSVLVLGSGRSGTSMLAGTLAEAGWSCGDDPYAGRDSNPKGFFETEEVNGINEALMAGAFPTATPAGRMQRWLAVTDGVVPAEAPEHLARRIERLCAQGPFAFKDPRFCVTLPAWRAHAGEVGMVCVFRSPAVTAESTLREVATQDYLRGVELDFDGAVELWMAMYSRVLEQRHAGDWLFLHADQLLTEEGLARLEAFVGGPVRRDFPEARLQRTRSERPVPQAAAEVYEELCALAGYTAAPLAACPAPAGTPVDPPELSVLVCTYQRKDTLARCLRSFEAQTATGRYELVVVNDGATDGTQELLDGWDFQVPTRVVHRENGGLSAARNSGLEVARGQYVLLVNDDTIAHPELVEQHLAAHARESGEVAIQGTFEQPAAALDNALMRVLEDDTLVFCYSQLEPGVRNDWNAFWTCNVSVSAQAVRRVGGLDESFRHYGCEDTDLAIRLHGSGVEMLYEPAARAEHDHLLDLDDLARRNVTTASAWVRLFRKHPAALDHPSWSSRRDMSVSSLERALVAALPERPVLEASVRTLSELDLGALERTGPAGAELARSCESALRDQLKVLNQLWWAEGHVAGLRGFGVESFAELEAASAEAAAVSEAATASEAGGDGPWPLATEAEHRLLAWPRYGDEGDLERLLSSWAECLASCESACLCLRHDEAFDGPLEAGLARLQAAWDTVVPPGTDLEVLVVDGPMGPDDLARLGEAVEAVIDVEGCTDPAREAFLNVVARPRMTSPEAV